MSHVFVILTAFSALFSAVLGIFVLSRRFWHLPNIGFALGMFSMALVEVGNTFFLLSDSIPMTLFWKRVSLAGEILLPCTWLLFSLTFARADHKTLLKRWRPLFFGMTAVSLYFLSRLGSPDMIALPENAAPYFFRVGPVGHYFYIFLLLGLVLNLIHLENTFRSSSLSQRRQTQYLLGGVGAILTFHIFLSSQILLFYQLNPYYIPLSSAVTLMASGFLLFLMVRHRLLDVDIYISRYVVYNSATVFLVGMYLLLTGVGAQAIRWFGGSMSLFWSTAFLFLSLSAAVVLLLSVRVRRSVQLFITRNFYRHKYDFREKWMETTHRLGAAESIESLQVLLLDLVQETLGAREVALYLTEPEQKEFRPVLTRFQSGSMNISQQHPLLRHLLQEKYPFILEEAAMRDGLPAEACLCTPLLAGTELLGFILQSEDLSGVPYSTDDFRILHAISIQAASLIRNDRLASQLLRNRESEAFHEVSSFFVHDLKNLVSTLSLLVQNSEEHMTNPAFQQEAMKTLTATVAKMESMISRLILMSRGLTLNSRPIDLNGILEETLATLNGRIGQRLVRQYDTIPLVLADDEQIQKVILNLLLNAIEASGTGSEVCVRTQSREGEVILSVVDQGCGISQEFIQTSLFRPFRTTKPHGLGIGLFQCKKIMEAHHGRIEVESRESVGSEFRIVLPVSSLTGKKREPLAHAIGHT